MDPGKRTFYLGRYNCIELLGTGPIGETYRAKIYGVAGFEKQFAVKRLFPQLSEDEAFVARFVRAASAFAALEHEGISRVHEVNAQGAHYYIVVDLVRGLDLRRLLDLLQQRGEALAPDAAMTIAVEIAAALEHAHAKTNILPGGVLHLGLTAPSVMVTYEGDVKLVDVGLLAALMRPGWADDDALTPTLAYLAPEVWRAETIDARADVFSLGVVLHELLGGIRVFLSDRAADLRKTIESGPPAPPPADPRLQQIVTRALEPDPARRFASIEEMRVAIQGILGGRIERARADLSAVVRRLSAPRDRRTGAFAAVTLPPAVLGMTSPVTANKPPPIPPPTPAPHTWAPPTPRPPVGASLSPIPVHNTLAGIGPDDQTLVPIELVELPGLPTEKAMPTVSAEDVETNRAPRAESELTSAASPPPPPAPAPPAPARGAPIDAPSAQAPAADMAAPASGNGTVEPEPSWAPPQLAALPPSPEPLFAEPAPEKPAPVEPAKSTVPGVTLPPPRRGGTAAVLGGVGLLAAVGGLAIYAGLSGSAPMVATTSGSATPPPTIAAAVLDAARLDESRAGRSRSERILRVGRGGERDEEADRPRRRRLRRRRPRRLAARKERLRWRALRMGRRCSSMASRVARRRRRWTWRRGATRSSCSAKGRRWLKQTVVVAPGGRLDLALEPAKLPAAVAGSAGLKVRCKSHGELRIFVDGADSGRTCPNDERISVAPGPHKIGLFSARTGEMHEIEHEVTEGNNSTRVYVKY